MCLQVLHEDWENPIQTAKEDIVVYKILKQKTNESPYYIFKYEAGTLYRLRRALNVWFGMVYTGYHAYLDRDTAFFRKTINKTKVVKMIIPKGAKFCVGTRGDVVSTSLRSGNLKALKNITTGKL